MREKVLMLASVASMIGQFNLPNIDLLQRMGYEVHAACNFKEGNTCSAESIRRLKRKLHDAQVVWHQWDCPRSVCAAAKCLKAYRQLLELTGQYDFAWMHCHSPVGGALARMAAHKRGIPVIYTAHGFHFYKGAPIKNWLLYYPVEKFLARWTDILITVNREDYRLAEKNMKAGRVFYIPGIGIDTERYQTKGYTDADDCMQEHMQDRVKDRVIDRMQFRAEHRIPEDAVILLSVGELSKRKNHRAVIAALASMRRKNVYYFIYGQGPLRGELRSYAKRLGIAGYVRMPGYEEDMAHIYQNADIFVFPSKQEGMPAALMEAMAAGLPCAVSDIRGSRELIPGARGVRFGLGGYPGRLRQTEQIERVLIKLMDDKKLRMQCSAYNRKKIKAYDLSVVLSRMEVIYKEVADAVPQREKGCL